MKKGESARPGAQVAISQLPAGRVLFKEGDRDKLTLWVISGLVELREGDSTVAMIRGGTAEARNPLPASLPRKQTARAVDPIEYLSVDSETAGHDDHLGSDGTYEVAELQAQLSGNAGDDWMTTLLQTQTFSSHSARQHPGHFPAHAAHELSRRRSDHPAGRGRRLLLCHRQRQMSGDARDAAQSRWAEAG